MKKLSVLFSLVFLLLISCNQGGEQDIQPATTDVAAAGSADNYLASARPIVPSMYQIITSGGQYISGYGGGITFGTSFIRETTVDPTGNTDGQPEPGFTFVNPQVGGVVTYNIEGNFFGILMPGGSNPNPDTGEAEAWLSELMDGWLAGTGGRVAAGGRTATAPGGGGVTPPDGMILISGQVVRDHNSPTNAAVTSIDYVYSPGNPPGDNGGSTGQCTVPLANANKYNKVFHFYTTLVETSGVVCKVTATTDDGAHTPFTVTSKSLTYTSNFSTATIVGTVTLQTSPTATTTYSFNDTLPVPQF